MPGAEVVREREKGTCQATGQQVDSAECLLELDWRCAETVVAQPKFFINRKYYPQN